MVNNNDRLSNLIVHIPIEELQSNPLQPRGVITPETLVDLVDSIREHGILEPLVVAKTPAGYQIIAGERRWRAARIVGLKTVPAVIKETTPRGMLEMAIVENVQRIDLNPIERAKAFSRLNEEFGLSTAEIARRVGKSQAYVSNSLRLLTLPDALKDGLLSGLISEGHARALAAVADNRLMVEAYKIILKENGSVRRAEDLARRMKKQSNTSSTERSTHIVSEEIDHARDMIFGNLGKRMGDDKYIKVKISRSRIEARVIIVLRGSLEQTQATFEYIRDRLSKN